MLLLSIIMCLSASDLRQYSCVMWCCADWDCGCGCDGVGVVGGDGGIDPIADYRRLFVDYMPWYWQYEVECCSQCCAVAYITFHMVRYWERLIMDHV